MKSLSVTNMDELREEVSDVEVHGDPGRWVCVCKASSGDGGWMKSTKVMQVGESSGGASRGCLVQVTTQQGDSVAEALTFVPGAMVEDFR